MVKTKIEAKRSPRKASELDKKKTLIMNIGAMILIQLEML